MLQVSKIKCCAGLIGLVFAVLSPSLSLANPSATSGACYANLAACQSAASYLQDQSNQYVSVSASCNGALFSPATDGCSYDYPYGVDMTVTATGNYSQVTGAECYADRNRCEQAAVYLNQYSNSSISVSASCDLGSGIAPANGCDDSAQYAVRLTLTFISQ